MRTSIRSSRLPNHRSRRFISGHPTLFSLLLGVAAALAVLFCFPCAVRAQSALDGFDPNANGIVRSIAVQADGKILIGGGFTTLSPNGGAAVTRNRIARLNTDGTLDASFDPNADSDVYSIAVQTDGKILIGGNFTTLSPNGGAAVTRNRIARLNTDGTLDASFDPNADSFVYSIAVQADGKILIGGDFTTLSPNGGVAVTRNRIARLNTDGTLDASFDPKASDNVLSIAVQADGKILIGGSFTTLSPNGGAAVTRNRIARLNTDGTLDASFNPNADNTVFSIAVQADGKILIGGSFTTLSPNGGAAVTRNRIARLNTDGTLDASFNPNADSDVSSIAVQTDGKILIGGNFITLSPNGGAAVTRNRIARLNADGTLDASFDPNANSDVLSIAVQADGKILIGGGFTTLSPNGGAAVTRNRIARLNTDGTLDTAFDPNANGIVVSIAVQADGKILIGGNFTTLSPNGGAAVTRNRIARLNTDGTLDASFDPNASGIVVFNRRASGRKNPDWRRLHHPLAKWWSGGDAQPHRAPEYGRHARHRLRPERERYCLFNRRANGRENPDWRRLHHPLAKWWSGGDTQSHRAPEYGRHARHRLRPERER